MRWRYLAIPPAPPPLGHHLVREGAHARDRIDRRAALPETKVTRRDVGTRARQVGGETGCENSLQHFARLVEQTDRAVRGRRVRGLALLPEEHEARFLPLTGEAALPQAVVEQLPEGRGEDALSLHESLARDAVWPGCRVFGPELTHRPAQLLRADPHFSRPLDRRIGWPWWGAWCFLRARKQRVQHLPQELGVQRFRRWGRPWPELAQDHLVRAPPWIFVDGPEELFPGSRFGSCDRPL